MQNKKTVPFYIKWLLSMGIILLVVMTILRVVLYKTFPPSPSDTEFHLSTVLFLGFRFDARYVCIFLTLLFLLCIFNFSNPFKKMMGRKIALTLIGIVVVWMGVFYITDFANYAYLKTRMSSDLLNLLGDGKSEAIGMMWESYPIIKMLIGLILFCVVFYQIFKRLFLKISKQANEAPTPVKSAKIVSGILFFLLMFIGIFGKFNQFPLRWSDAFALGDNTASNMALNPFQSFFSSLKFKGEHLDMKKVDDYYPLMAKYLGVKNPNEKQLNFKRENYINDSTTTTKPNVVVVICESFSYFKSSMSGNVLDPSPYFNQMCQNGLFFDRCFTPSYGTARGVWATFTGIPDVDMHSTSSRNPKAVDQHNVMSQFEGYDKKYFIGGNLTWANVRAVLANNVPGLKTYEQDDYDAPKIDVWGVSDKNLFLGANKVFSQEKKPFFAIIQTADNHRPYTIPDEDRKKMKNLKNYSDAELHKNGFDKNIELDAFKYTDFNYQNFIEAAKKEPYFKNTIFVFVGDHGIRGNASSLLPTEAWNAELTSEHVPLLFYAPYLIKPQRNHNIASQVDIMPTVASLAHMPVTITTMGRSLVDSSTQPHGAFIYDYNTFNIGYVQDSLYYGVAINGKPQDGKLYNVKSNAPVKVNNATMQYYFNMANAYYYTSRYMLLNNKK